MPVAKAVILAAGLSTRLGGAARGPKPLLPVAGVPILHRALASLRAVGVREIVVVVGHRSEEVVASLRELLARESAGVNVDYVFSDRYRTTNNLYSLWLAREHLDQDIYLLDGDVVFDLELAAGLDEPGVSTAAAVRYQQGMTGTILEVGEDGRVLRMVDVRNGDPELSRPRKAASVYLLRRDFLEELVPALERAVGEGRVDAFYEAALAELLDRRPLIAVDCSHLRWAEVDDLDDFANAEYLFSSSDQRYAQLAHAHGRFQQPGHVDHLVMTNVYFPPEALRRDLRRMLDRVILDYPVGQRTLAELMAGFVGASPEDLVVANGASELIKHICGSFERHALVVVPTFNEYEEALPPGRLVQFHLRPPDFELDPEAVSRAAAETGAELAVVASPNNPTSLAVPRDALLDLCERFARTGTRLIVDESFVDFCSDPDAQSLRQSIADRPNLAIVKSLSMSCGIPGLRLACLLTADRAFSEDVRASLPIWNVNGVAEGFLRLLPRYKGTLEQSCRQVRRDCDELAALLREIPGVDVPSPSACFCLITLPEGVDGHEVALRLFVDHALLVKDCSQKTMPEGRHYLRVKSRTPPENRRLVSALELILGDGPAARGRLPEQATAS
jgi:histidinol-phosphate/aromatic aminotransferase/cobyric acid decarboxylase-like protein/CTP:phosphocholine cytidylyltransferase-like protein